MQLQIMIGMYSFWKKLVPMNMIKWSMESLYRTRKPGEFLAEKYDAL